MNRVIGGLTTRRHHLRKARQVPSTFLNRIDQGVRRQMIRARAAHQQTIPRQQLHRQLIDALIRSLAFRRIFTALNEGRGVNDDAIKLLTSCNQGF